MKLSIGLDIIMRWRWSSDAIRRYSDHVLDLFGPDRVMAASNWPVILLGAGYQETWNGITDLVADLSVPERHAVLGGTAERILCPVTLSPYFFLTARSCRSSLLRIVRIASSTVPTSSGWSGESPATAIASSTMSL